MDDSAERSCSYCGRKVKDTLHWRESYRVDFHFLYTGDVERERMTSDEEGRERYLVRLLRPRWVFACVDCYARPEVRDDWETWLEPREE